jgi:AraC-like DNA-binding protein
MDLRIDRDIKELRRGRTHATPGLLFPLESTAISLRTGEDRALRLDRSTFAVIPARASYQIDLPASATAVVLTLLIPDAIRIRAALDYSPYIDAGKLAEVLASVRVLPRTRWVDELVNRYVFEREVCAKETSRAALFLESELTKEVFFLGSEQIAERTRSSVLFEGDPLVVRARAWIEEHMFEPFTIRAILAHCHASESTLLRAFRRELGVTPLAYVRQRRLEEALQMLESGRYGVTEVAARVGYESASAFAVAFRERFGVTPSRAKVSLPAATRLPAHGAPPEGRRRGRV